MNTFNRLSVIAVICLMAPIYLFLSSGDAVVSFYGVELSKALVAVSFFYLFAEIFSAIFDTKELVLWATLAIVVIGLATGVYWMELLIVVLGVLLFAIIYKLADGDRKVARVTSAAAGVFAGIFLQTLLMEIACEKIGVGIALMDAVKWGGIGFLFGIVGGVLASIVLFVKARKSNNAVVLTDDELDE